MCGIGGWLCLTNASRVDPKTLLRMRDTMHIGGPGPCLDRSRTGA